jgi:hypothetical protein
MDENVKGRPELELDNNSHGLDLALASFACAAHSSKRASCCTPFPSDLLRDDGERDYMRALDAIRDYDLFSPPVQSERPSQAMMDLSNLVEFMLSDSQHRKKFRLQAGASNAPPLPFVRPTHIFERITDEATCSSDRSSLCYHGTSFNRLWCILHKGLQASMPEGSRGPLSKNLLGKNGQIYGHGVYLTTNANVALTFSETAFQPWESSMLGRKIRVVLVCRLDTSKDDGKGHGSSSLNQPPVPDDLPPHYLLVRDSEAIEISHILIYTDEKHKPKHPLQAGQSSSSWLESLDFFKLCIIAYIAFLVLQSFANNKHILALLYPQ